VTVEHSEGPCATPQELPAASRAPADLVDVEGASSRLARRKIPSTCSHRSSRSWSEAQSPFFNPYRVREGRPNSTVRAVGRHGHQHRAV